MPEPRPPAAASAAPIPAPSPVAAAAPTAWFAADAERHRLDAPRHCPRCGEPVVGSGGLVVEYWAAEDRVFYCWCRACDWTGTIVQLRRHVGHEATG